VDVPRMLERLQRDALAGGETRRQVSLELMTEDGLFGSMQELESAFTNLLVNGIKYTLPDGTVRMRWWSDDEGAYFSVTDNGIGIPAEHIPRLTERFYRVDAGRSRDRGGSGLGLAIVKHALQRHGGVLEVQSVEGKGSTFTCHFPRQRISQAALRTAVGA
jgi:two-component system phosphate regulon sensor histidine kinase PhoR